MEILVCPDHNYVMPCGIMLKSLFCNNTKESINVHAIIDNNVTRSDRDSLKEIVEESNGVISFYDIDPENISNYPGLRDNYISRSAYYRMFVAEILPENIEKILYLDGDIIIRKSLLELWNTDLNSYAIGCVMDMLVGKPQIYNRLRIPYEAGYFNSGMMLINLKYWRENNILAELLQFIKDYPERISASVDQDVLGYVLRDRKKFLPLKYNVQEGFFFKPEYASIDYWKYEDQLTEAINDPVILHFTGRSKPWIKGCNHPRKQDFFIYKGKTKWANDPLQKEKMSFINRIKKDILMVLVYIGISEKEENKFIIL